MEEFNLDDVLNIAVLDVSILFREMLTSNFNNLLWSSIFAFLEHAGVDSEECHRIHKLVLEQIKKENKKESNEDGE